MAAARYAAVALAAVAVLCSVAHAQEITITPMTGSGPGEVDLFYSTSTPGILSIGVSISGPPISDLETHSSLVVGGKVTSSTFSMFDLAFSGLPVTTGSPAPLVTMTFASAIPGVSEVCVLLSSAFTFDDGFFDATIPAMMDCALVGGLPSTMMGSGSALSDPHMSGLMGQQFDFMGEPSKIYALISDQTMEINALFDTAWVTSSKMDSDTLIAEPMMKRGTWIREIGVLLGENQILMSVDTSVPSYACPESIKHESDTCFRGGSLLVNGESVFRIGSIAIDASLSITAKNSKSSGRVSVVSDDLKLNLDNVPPPSRWKIENQSKEDYSHLNMHIVEIRLTAEADGVLGQTSRMIFDSQGEPITSTQDPNGGGVLANPPEDFEVSAIFATDSKVNKYAL